ncbi:MAG: hypothetical protein ACYSUD_02655 [Planctomycetota bacterium]|jgi:hypothetical protein
MAWNANDKKTETKRTGPGKVVEVRGQGKGAAGAGEGRGGPGTDRDLGSGMEMLEMDFLLGVVENTKGDDKNDVMMRKLVFNELLRREQLDAIDSNALSVYTIDGDKLYGKNIQCEAMKKLTERTTR